MTEKTVRKKPAQVNDKGFEHSKPELSQQIKDLLDPTKTPNFDTKQTEELKSLCRKFFID